jgi:hypothetical protein
MPLGKMGAMLAYTAVAKGRAAFAEEPGKGKVTAQAKRPRGLKAREFQCRLKPALSGRV